MADLIITLAVIFGILLCYGAGVLLLTLKRVGWSVVKVKQYYKLKPTYKDWLTAGFITLGVVLALGLFRTVKADDFNVTYLDYTDVYFGLDYQNQNPVCEDGSLDENISANIGIRQHIVGTPLPIGRVDGVLNYTHHSCAIGSDSDNGVYDGFGIMMVYRIDW